MANNSTQIYHEKQKLQFCLLHALNNLFQDKDAFTKESLNDIAKDLVSANPCGERWSPFSLVATPFHNALTGNYDANVLEYALNRKGKSVIWQDARRGTSDIDLDDISLMGIILNVMKRKFLGMWNGRHWIALRKIDGSWYNLDSDLNSPHRFDNAEAVLASLQSVIDGGAEVLLVINSQHPVYHEKQIKEYCLLHTLNNLFQERNAFTRASLNHIAKSLLRDDPNRHWWTPLMLFCNRHYNIFTGNYDVNVLDAALRSKGKTMVWHNRNEELNLEDKSLMGIVLNVQKLNARHWVAVRKINDYWYILDSEQRSPYRFDSIDKFTKSFKRWITSNAHVFLVRND